MSEGPASANLNVWNQTVLWDRLTKCDEHDAQEVKALLTDWMPRIQAILTSGGTAPEDFTLHDQGHAFRVAQRMTEIIPEATIDGMSPYDIAFLLLSAYLHDIGMTPAQCKVSLHYQYLLTGQSEGLLDDEMEEFQRYLDDDQEGLTPPLCVGPPTPDDLRRANRLVAHYCRERHNDWGAEWTRSNAPRRDDRYVPMGKFHDWLDDLIRLCRSHHFGRAELVSEEFNPRLVGQPGQVLHLRYLACALRVADVLEFDPERTPNVVLQHRDVDPKSVIFWHKDHGISPRLENERLIISARPKTAWLYRAIEETLDQIDQELSLCRTLSEDTHFENCPGLVAKLPYHWQLMGMMHRDLKPEPGSFVYINSSFRPNTEKILQLLSGIELYGDPRTAVRELLQNAFDAVREQMAHQRLSHPHPSDRELAKDLGKRHRVELRLEQRNDGYWLICSDTGVGMNKRLIENSLLVSGQSRRHDVAALERRCRQAGFTTGRTGQFGIGVLSYFMIADRLSLATRRSLEPGDADSTGWTFETNGVAAWGELRADGRLPPGTSVALHLKRETIDDPASWYADIREYVLQTVTLVPCEFHVNSAIPGCEPAAFNPGWTRSEADLVEMVLRDMRSHDQHERTPPKLLPSHLKTKAEDEERRWDELREKAGECLRWVVEEDELPDGLGRYRLHVPYFDLPGGASLSFMEVEASMHSALLGRIGKGFSFTPGFPVAASWKGVRVAVDMRDVVHGNFDYDDTIKGTLSFRRLLGLQSSAVEVDFDSDTVGKLAIDRAGLNLSELGWNCLKWLRDRSREVARNFITSRASSNYAAMNARRVACSEITIKNPHWVTRRDPDPQHAAVWAPVRFPAVDSVAWKYSALPTRVTWRDKEVTVLSCVGGVDDDDHYDGLPWNGSEIPPDCVVSVPSYDRSVALLWKRNPWTGDARSVSNLPACEFPPKWRHLVGAHVEQQHVVWNASHPVVKVLNQEAAEWIRAITIAEKDPVGLRDEIVHDTPRAAAWLLSLILSGNDLIWRGLIEREPEFVRELWEYAWPKGSRQSQRKSIGFWVQDPGRRRLRVITPESWKAYNRGNATELDSLMPDPGPNWTLQVEYAKEVFPEASASIPGQQEASRKAARRRQPSNNTGAEAGRRRTRKSQ